MRAVPIRSLARVIIIGTLLAVVLLSSPAPSDAEVTVLVSNTGQRGFGSTPVGDYDHAQGFTTGTYSPGYVLTSIELNVGTAPANGTLTVTVREASGDDPSGTDLYTLTNPSNLGTGYRTFDALDDSILNANTTYFVVMTFNPDANATQPQWGATDSNRQDSVSQKGWSIANHRHTRSAGTVNWSSVTNAKIKIEVTGEYRRLENLSAEAGNGEVTLSWKDPDSDAITGYDISSDDGASYTRVASDSTNLTYDSAQNTIAYTVTGLTNGDEHDLAVRAVSVSGINSVGGEASTVTATPLLPAPTNLSAVPYSGRVVLEWDSGGAGYENYLITWEVSGSVPDPADIDIVSRAARGEDYG